MVHDCCMRAERYSEGQSPRGVALAGCQGGLWQWRKMWIGEKEEMTVKIKVDVDEILGINVRLDIWFLSVVVTL